MPKYMIMVLAVLLLVALGGCDESPASGGGQIEPAHTLEFVTVSPSTSATVMETPGNTASAAPDTTQPDETASVSPDGTTQPDNTSETENSETDTPDPTKTVKPTTTPSGTGSLSVEPVIGKADVNDHLTLRKSASTTSKSLAEIPKDGEFTVLMVETGKKWLKVKYEDQTGYVQAKYVQVGSNDSDRVCTVFCNSALNVREGAGTKFDVIGSVAYGTTLIVKSKTTVSGKVWYEVEVGSSTGFVSAQYCRIAED